MCGGHGLLPPARQRIIRFCRLKEPDNGSWAFPRNVCIASLLPHNIRMSYLLVLTVVLGLYNEEAVVPSAQSLSRSVIDVDVVLVAAVMLIIPNDFPQCLKEPDNGSWFFCLKEPKDEPWVSHDTCALPCCFHLSRDVLAVGTNGCSRSVQR